jgi:hypothetical protein
VAELIAKPGINKNLFPVTRNAVDLALGEIALDACRAADNEGELIKDRNVYLNQLVRIRAQIIEELISDYREGVMWTHMIIRQQAELCGNSVPVLSHDTAKAYLHERTVQAVEKPQLTMEYYQEGLDRIASRDLEFGRAVDEVTKYRTEKDGLIVGMVEVYLLLQRADSIRSMGNWVVARE